MDKYDDFGGLVWIQPAKPKRKPKKLLFEAILKLLGDAPF
jgi:hypothetical protein